MDELLQAKGLVYLESLRVSLAITARSEKRSSDIVDLEQVSRSVS